MDEYKLTYEFKKCLVSDAIDCTRLGKSTFEQWAEDYLFCQEVQFPFERDYVLKVAFFLKEKKYEFDPYFNETLVFGLMNELERI